MLLFVNWIVMLFFIDFIIFKCLINLVMWNVLRIVCRYKILLCINILIRRENVKNLVNIKLFNGNKLWKKLILF